MLQPASRKCVSFAVARISTKPKIVALGELKHMRLQVDDFRIFPCSIALLTHLVFQISQSLMANSTECALQSSWCMRQRSEAVGASMKSSHVILLTGQVKNATKGQLQGLHSSTLLLLLLRIERHSGEVEPSWTWLLHRISPPVLKS